MQLSKTQLHFFFEVYSLSNEPTRISSLIYSYFVRAILDEEPYRPCLVYQNKYNPSDRQNIEIDNQLHRLEQGDQQNIKRIAPQWRENKYTVKGEKNKRKMRYKAERQALKDQKM